MSGPFARTVGRFLRPDCGDAPSGKHPVYAAPAANVYFEMATSDGENPEIPETEAEKRDRRGKARTRKIRRNEDRDALDRGYWASLQPIERMAMCWQLFGEWAALKGLDEDQLRLRRSVASIQRRRR